MDSAGPDASHGNANPPIFGQLADLCSNSGTGRAYKEVPESSSVPIIVHFFAVFAGKKALCLRVYVAAISARHIGVDNQTMGSHTLVTRFFKGAQWRTPLQAVKVPSWSLDTLCFPPFELLEQSGLKWLSAKVDFLLAMASAKRE